MTQPVNFKISSALKNIIGRELINDKYIAVFEIVKNSYDAGANRVDIEFQNFESGTPTIIISDDGSGMSYEDLKNKWLFVAYSEKKVRNRPETYRDNIKRKTAGAKGVGRFSCDRLGSDLIIYTKTDQCKLLHKLEINWDNFEEDDKNEFINIPVTYSNPTDYTIKDHGTKVIINNLREPWKEDDLKKLRDSISRLINPEYENDGEDSFKIFFSIPDLKEADGKKQLSERLNGEIKNDIFEKMGIKTTNVSVEIDKNGQEIETTLFDRGDFIYKIVEKNPYVHLSGIKVKLFFMNRSAKAAFSTIMGIQPVQYGSVFVYRNNFRVHPYGEEGNDLFQIDRRKQQGYARNLGTRDLLGRIIIETDDKHFIESSSRNNGFLDSPESRDLHDFFEKKALLCLEKYVVEVIKWGNVTKVEELEGKEPIAPEEVIDKIIMNILNINPKDAIKINWNEDLIGKITESQQNSLTTKITKLEKLADSTQDKALISLTKDIKQKTTQFYAETKQKDKKVEKLAKELESTRANLYSEKGRNFFLSTSLSSDQVEFQKKMHIVKTLTDSIKTDINTLHKGLQKNTVTTEEIMKFLMATSYSIERINASINYSGVANFDLEQERISGDMAKFVQEYFEKLFKNTIKIHVKNNALPTQLKFCPQDVATILENIVSNSIKARARNLYVEIFSEESFLVISIRDDGIGLNKHANPDAIFEFGKSYTDGGTGVGLFHVKQIVHSLGGSVTVDAEYKGGFKINMRIGT